MWIETTFSPLSFLTFFGVKGQSGSKEELLKLVLKCTKENVGRRKAFQR